LEYIQKINKEEAFTLLLLKSKCKEVQKYLLSKISNDELLLKIIKNCKNKEIVKEIIDGCDSIESLNALDKAVGVKMVKKMIQKRLAKLNLLNKKEPTVEEKLEQLCVDAEQAVKLKNVNVVEEKLALIREEFVALSGNNYPDYLKRLSTVIDNFLPRYEKVSELKAHRDAYEALCAEIEALAKQDEITFDLNRYKEQQKSIGEIEPQYKTLLDKRFAVACRQIELRLDAIEKAKHLAIEHLRDLKAILVDLERAVNDKKINRKKIERLIVSFTELKESIADSYELNGIVKSFDMIVENYNVKKEALQKEEEQKRADEQERVTYIFDAMKECVKSENILEQASKVKALQSDWKSVSSRYRKDKEGEFNKLTDEFNKKLDEAYEERKWEQQHNYVLKKELVKKAEILSEIEDIFELSKAVKELRNKWKAIGPVPHEKDAEIWNTFNDHCNIAYERCSEFFAKLDKEREANLISKEALCEKAEALQESTEWNKTAEALKALQAEWKTIGRAPKDKEDKVYNRFRTACDKFFNARKVYFGERDDSFSKVKEQKESVCAEVEEFDAASADSKTIISFMRDMRGKWKALGGAGKYENELWERFNGELDKLYETLEQFRPENSAKKEVLCERIEEVFNVSDEDINYKTTHKLVQDLMSEWKEVGPAEKEKEDILWERFNGVIDIFYKKRQDFFEEMNKNRGANGEIKKKLIEQLREVTVSPKNWKDASVVVKEIQAKWRETGAAEKEDENALWSEYKKLCDEFFGQRREFIEKRQGERESNYRRKQALCVEAEVLADISVEEEETGTLDIRSLAEELEAAMSDNLTATTQSPIQRAKELQAKWKTIGPADREKDELLYQRFRRACDAIFKKK
jgi:hypothetical protein